MDLHQTTNRNKHRPHHIYSGYCYFLTGRCYKGASYFKSKERKILFQKVLKESIDRFGINLYVWVVLDNHYHLLISSRTHFACGLNVSIQTNSQRNDEMSPQANLVESSHNEWNDEMSSQANFVNDSMKKYHLVELIRKLHKDTAREINKQDKEKSRKIWYQYHDYNIQNKPDFWRHFNYIIQNPLKHKLVKNLEESYLYPYSSNPTWLKN